MAKAKKKKVDLEVGRRIQAMLTLQGITQSELARRIGYSNNAISNLVNGYNNLTPRTAQKIADILGCLPEYFLYGTSLVEFSDDEANLTQRINTKNKKTRYSDDDLIEAYCLNALNDLNCAQQRICQLLETIKRRKVKCE